MLQVTEVLQGPGSRIILLFALNAFIFYLNAEVIPSDLYVAG